MDKWKARAPDDEKGQAKDESGLSKQLEAV